MASKLQNELRVDNIVVKPDGMKLCISEDKLFRILNPHIKEMQKIHEWWGPVGCAVTIGLTLLTTNFKTVEGIPNFNLIAMSFFVLLLLACLVLIGIAINNQRTHTPTTDEIIDDLMDEGVYLDEHGNKRKYHSKHKK